MTVFFLIHFPTITPPPRIFGFLSVLLEKQQFSFVHSFAFLRKDLTVFRVLQTALECMMPQCRFSRPRVTGSYLNRISVP